MKRHDDRQRSDRFAVTRPVHHTLPPHFFKTEKQLTAPADRPVRESAHTVAFTTAVAIGGVRSVHRRTGMLAARVLPGNRNRPGSPPATNCAQYPPPALAAIQTHCCSDHRHAWRRNGCGRNAHCCAPPAQIRTWSLNHPAPTSGECRQTAGSAMGGGWWRETIVFRSCAPVASN